MRGDFKKNQSKQPITGFVLLAVAVAAFPFLNYYFGTFYNGNWQQYKIWFPRFFFLLYPLVKFFPFLFLAVALWLIRNFARNSILKILHVLRETVHRLKSGSSAQKKTVSDATTFLFQKLKKPAMNLLLLFTTIFVVLLAAEYALRAFGLKAGYRIYSQYFTPVDSLRNLKGFIADSNGIFCVSPDARDFIRSELATKKTAEELLPLDRLQSTEVYTLPKDFLALRQPDYHSTFKTFLATTHSPADTSDREFFAAVQEYAQCPINTNGFKSIAFRKYPSRRKSILLLGDSFTWGHSSSNKTNCFADILLAKGYVVYNTGITGTDPAQYLQIARILVPQLKPDYVVANFYMGNDIVYFERKPEPYVPVFYCTNAGNIISCPEGIYFYDAQEAYQHTLSVFTIPAANNGFNRFCSKTVIGTLVWRIAAKFHLVDALLPQYIAYYDKVRTLTTKTPYSDIQLKHIQEITEQYGGTFLLTVIPSLDGKDFLYPEEKQPLFTGMQYFVPPITLEHYLQKLDGHYNDLGHKMHAAFIDSLIRNSDSGGKN